MNKRIGTHNSYHRPSSLPIQSWNYKFPTLYEQLKDHKVRHLELDIHYNFFKKDFTIKHLPLLDPNTSVETLDLALQEIASFSQHNFHEGIFIYLEPKFYYYTFCKKLWGELDKKLSVFPNVTCYYEKNYINSSYDFENQVVFILLDPWMARKSYLKQKNNIMFPCGESHLFVNVDNPTKKDAVNKIKKLVQSDHIVRTRIDRAGQSSIEQEINLMMALQSGAQVLATDSWSFLWAQKKKKLV